MLTYLALGFLGFVIPVVSALVVALTSASNGDHAFGIVVIAGVFNQLPFLGLAFQLNRKIDPWGKKVDKGNKSHSKAVVVELLSLLAINVAVCVDLSKSILNHNSPFAGVDIIVLPLVTCVAMALGYLIAYVAAEFLNGLRGEKKKAPQR